MFDKFYDRKNELDDLEKKYKELNTGELCIIYGRKRLGKTTFIKEFLKKNKGKKVYYFVNKTNKKELLEIMSDNIFEQTNQRIKFFDWDDFFEYLIEESKKEKMIFVMDEFPRLEESSPEFITKFQNVWDTHLKKQKMMFVAIGSSMSMMHNIFLHKTSPLYGRLTYKLYLKPFKYDDFREMFKELPEQKKVEIYSVFGGTPHFLWFVKKHQKEPLINIISNLTLSKTAVLKDEPLNFITMELKKETNYNAILYAISSTKGDRQEIIQKTNIKQKDIDYYINNLINLLSIIEQNKPIFYNKDKKKRYGFTDNFFEFWYNYIFPNQTYLELDNLELLKNKIRKDLNAFIGKKFEGIIKELFIKYNGKKIKDTNINFNEINSWWGKTFDGNTEEIDLVMNNTETKETIVCEIKWNEKLIKKEVPLSLDRKTKLLRTKKIKHIIVSKNGFEKSCIEYMEEKNMLYLNLEDIKELFDKQ